MVIQTIAATRTSGGLRVEVALDRGDYPTGVAISKQRLAALPLQRHDTHSAWNYTLLPHPVDATSPAPEPEHRSGARRRRHLLDRLTDPRLTGMNLVELQRLTAALAPNQAARTQQRHCEQRGGRARRATGDLRVKPIFDDAARLLLTLLYRRQICSLNVLADLLEVTAACIGDTIKQTREVLEDHGHTAGTASVRFATADALLAFLDSDQLPARTRIIARLSHPALTGMPPTELHALTERLAIPQAAQAERLHHQRRGAPRQPNTRAGVFPQKISNSERVLLTVLYDRKLCSIDILADALGDVSRTAIGNVIRETRPLLRGQGLTAVPASKRYRTAVDLLAATESDSETSPG